jgi:hypothetical protein
MPRPDVEGQEGCLSTFNTSFLLQNVPYSGQWSDTGHFIPQGNLTIVVSSNVWILGAMRHHFKRRTV